MLNEPNPEAVPPSGTGGGAGGAGGMGGDTPGGGHMSYIQVTPQEKEAIERVRMNTVPSLTLSNISVTLPVVLEYDAQMMMLPKFFFSVYLLHIVETGKHETQIAICLVKND